MKIYHIIHTYNSFDHGCYDTLHGTFSSLDKAEKSVKQLLNNWSHKQFKRTKTSWALINRDQDTEYVEIIEEKLDKLTRDI